MKQNLYIGLDIGTSSVKGVLLTDDKNVVATTRFAFPYDTDNNGKVEIPAEKYLQSCYSALRDLAEQAPLDGEIRSVCASSASGNVLLLDKSYKPITPIVNWQDKRTCNEVSLVLGESFDYESYYKSTGWAFDKQTFPLATLCRWKAQNILKNADYVAMSTEYLYHCLTGSWGISTSAGTPFYLIDQQSGAYRTDILELLGLHENMLPPVVKVGDEIGKIKDNGKLNCPQLNGVPVYAGTFDHPSAARGVGVLQPGEMLLSCGTSWVGFYPVESRELAVKNKMLIDPFLSENGGAWAGMVSLASVASKIEEYIRRYITDDGNIYKTFEQLSSQSESGAGGLTITFTEADSDLSTYPKNHIARAIMEGVVHKLESDFERLRQGGISAHSAVMVGGPTECPLWTTVIEEITGMKVEIRHGAFAGAIGAASIGMQ